MLAQPIRHFDSHFVSRLEIQNQTPHLGYAEDSSADRGSHALDVLLFQMSVVLCGLESDGAFVASRCAAALQGGGSTESHNPNIKMFEALLLELSNVLLTHSKCTTSTRTVKK